MRQNLIGAQICDGTPNKISIVQIWNPPDSGITFYLDVIDIAWNATQSVITSLNNVGAWDFNFGTEPLGDGVLPNPVRYLLDKDISVTTPSVIQLRNLQTATPYPPGRLFYESWGGSVGVSRITKFDDPIVLTPGTGIHARSMQNNVYNIMTVQGHCYK